MMKASPPQTEVSYLGWSGFEVRFPGAMPILIDPADDAAVPDERDLCLIVTHGHPEHVAGTAAFLKRAGRKAAATVLASPGVCRYLRRRSRNPRDRFLPCRPGASHAVGSISIDVFACRHMPFLPPEGGEAIRRLVQVASCPRLAAGIVGEVIRSPLPGPLLGFRLRRPGAAAIVFYGEGLHRRLDHDDVRRTAARLPADVLIAAVEPEDAAVMPQLVSAVGAPLMIAYEAHAPWRNGFAMPLADLGEVSRSIAALGHRAVAAHRHRPIRIPPR